MADFHAAYRDSTRGSTIKALQLRQQQMQELMAQAQQPRRVEHPMQAFGQMAQTLSAGIREGRAASQEAAGRQRFAELLAGGLTQDEMGEALSLDPDTALKYQEHSWETEKEQRQREQAVSDAAQKHQWDVDAATARVKADQDLAQAQRDFDAAQKQHEYEHSDQTAANLEASQTRLKELEAKQAETKAGADYERDVKLEQEKAKIAAQQAATTPQTGQGKAFMDYKNGIYGDPNTPEAKAELQKALAKENAISGKSQTISVDKDGNVTVTDASGPGAGGTDYSKSANPMEAYQKDASVASDFLSRTESTEQAIKGAGKTAPIIGPLLGTADDIVRALSNNKWDLSAAGAGDPRSRAMLSAEHVQGVLGEVAKMKGAISNYEDQLLASGQLGLSQTPEGNMALLKFGRAVAQRKVEKAQKAADYLKANGNLDAFETEWSKYVEANHLLQRDQQGNLTYEGVVVLPAANVPGNQQAQPAGAQPPAQPQTQPQTQPAPAENTFNDADIEETMRANNMTREQVMQALQKQGMTYGGP